MPRTSVNGTELYYEIRGTGAPLLMVMGGSGDAGHFDAIADLLGDEFMLVTYDGRGNGRGPAAAGWKTTSPEQQADDAAGLLAALVRSPAFVCGTSSGAVSRCVCWPVIPRRCAERSCTSRRCSRSSATSTRCEAR